MSRRRIFAATCTLSLLLGLGCHRKEPAEEKPSPVNVSCAHPSRVRVTDAVTLRGHVEAPPGGDLQVAPQVAGKIAQIVVTEGERVEQGALLATIEDAPSKDAVRQADAAVTQARAARDNANATLERTRALVAKGIAPKQELDDAVARADGAKGALDAAVASSDLARRTLGRVSVRASFAGVVTKILRGAGALVDGSAVTPILQMAAEGREFVADAIERELSPIEVGASASITLLAASDGAPPTLGTVRLRSSGIDPVSGFGYVRIALGSSKVAIGQYGQARVTLRTREHALVVPTAAIRGAAADGTEVVLCKGDHAEVRAVRTGFRDADIVEIVEGITESDLLALDHVLGLETGTSIVGAEAPATPSASVAKSISAPPSSSVSNAPSARPSATP
jgi:RND family efflux transporter MFP subunit